MKKRARKEPFPAGKEYVCKRCWHQWNSYKAGLPRCCARCKSAYWDVERKEKNIREAGYGKV